MDLDLKSSWHRVNDSEHLSEHNKALLSGTWENGLLQGIGISFLDFEGGCQKFKHTNLVVLKTFSSRSSISCFEWMIDSFSLES